MNTMSSQDEHDVNDALAVALGFTVHTIDDDNTAHSIWEGPLGIGYYKLFSPQFCSGWKHLGMLTKAMTICGYTQFELMKLGKGDWRAGFACPLGPCQTHGTSGDNWHGSQNICGANPGQAAAFAAVIALTSGTKVRVGRTIGEPDEWPVKLDDALKIVNVYIKSCQVGRYRHMRDWIVVNGQLVPPEQQADPTPDVSISDED